MGLLSEKLSQVPATKEEIPNVTAVEVCCSKSCNTAQVEEWTPWGREVPLQLSGHLYPGTIFSLPHLLSASFWKVLLPQPPGRVRLFLGLFPRNILFP